MNRRVFRIQDSEGRGPFRPGLSQVWIDEERTSMPPTFMEEFGWDIFDKMGRPGEHFGSAVRRVEDLLRWFSHREMRKLAALGYRIVSLSDARVLAESENQCVFARSRPLAEGATFHRWP